MPKMIFIERNGTRKEVDAPLGLSVLEIAHKHGVDLEGACEGSLACSTCHVVVEPDWYEALPEASDDEEDMLLRPSDARPPRAREHARGGCSVHRGRRESHCANLTVSKIRLGVRRRRDARRNT